MKLTLILGGALLISCSSKNTVDPLNDHAANIKVIDFLQEGLDPVTDKKKIEGLRKERAESVKELTLL